MNLSLDVWTFTCFVIVFLVAEYQLDYFDPDVFEHVFV